MKRFRIIVLTLLGMLFGFALGLRWIPKANADRAEEMAVLRLSLDQAQQAQAKAVAQRDQWKDEVDKLRQWSEEVHRLRAEVSLLNRQLAENQVTLERASRAARKAEVPEQSPNKLKAPEGAMAFESAPPRIQAALLRELGGAPGNGALGNSTDKTGKPLYAFKGQMADGRSIALRLAEDGTVLEKSTEIPADAVPAQIQSPVAQAFGNLTISGAREIFEGDRVIYEVAAKSSDAGMQITVREDGTILGYSAKFRPPEKEPSKPKSGR